MAAIISDRQWILCHKSQFSEIDLKKLTFSQKVFVKHDTGGIDSKTTVPRGSWARVIAIKEEKNDEQVLHTTVGECPPFEALEWEEMEEKEEENEKEKATFVTFSNTARLVHRNTLISASSEVLRIWVNAPNECIKGSEKKIPFLM